MSETPAAPTAVLIDDNLMFTMGIEGALRRLGFRVVTLPPSLEMGARVAERAPALVLVNLAARGVDTLELVRRLRAALGDTKLVGYHNHTDTATFHAAREAGADLVLANSAVMGHLPDVLAKAGLLPESA